MNVLVIEDDRKIAGLLERGLGENGHRVSVSCNGREGAEMMLTGGYDAALLDILLPRLNGLQVLEYVRARRCRTAIMMLTAVDTVPKIVEAFDLGADDYLVKPFLLEILLARLGAISRRQQSSEPAIFRAGDLTLDRRHRIVIQNGRSIHLTRKQCELLDVLMRRRGLVTTREELVEAGWGCGASVKDNTLDVYVHGLRSKLEVHETGHAELIRTIHGTGYMLMAR
jgi:two-component system copper resistance phosphate regulon response regulator CusR